MCLSEILRPEITRYKTKVNDKLIFWKENAYISIYL